MARCRACSAEIIWALTPAGKRMPLDAEPDVDGEWLLESTTHPGDDPYRTRKVRPGDPPERRHTTHWATCQFAEDFR